jgi:carboxymethylenebutenolidase
MAFTTRVDTVTVVDGSFDLHLWIPDRASGPGILLLQEIFGVGSYLRAVAERLVGRGYVVGAPDVFWRIQRNWAADHDEAGLNDSFAIVSKFDPVTGVADCVAAFERLGQLPEVRGGAGVLGFCLGGTLAYHVAVAAEPVVAVSYYGSSVAAGLDLAEQVHCPIQFHFGAHDPYIPIEQVRQIEQAMADRLDAEVHVQPDAGHAFDNHEAAMFHQPEAAAAAWALTLGFLEKHLPTS